MVVLLVSTFSGEVIQAQFLFANPSKGNFMLGLHKSMWKHSVIHKMVTCSIFFSNSTKLEEQKIQIPWPTITRCPWLVWTWQYPIWLLWLCWCMLSIVTNMQGALEIHHSDNFMQCNVYSNTINVQHLQWREWRTQSLQYSKPMHANSRYGTYIGETHWSCLKLPW
jgi:hypothetical protein